MARDSVTIQLILEGKDAKRAVDSLEREFGDLQRAGTRATDKVNRGLKDNTRSASTLEKTVKRGLTTAFIAAGAVGVRELSQLAQRTFDVASAVEETNAKFLTSLGNNVGKATDFINEYANALGLTNREAKDVLANQTNVARGLGFVEDEASDLAVEITTLAGDLSSFNNIPIEQTLRAIQGGIVGEREALKTLGIVVRETDVQERALLNTRKESAEDLSAQEKALASFQLITESAGVAVGDLERTQDGAANKARRLSAEIRELRDELAVNLLNSFEGAIDAGLGLVDVFDMIVNGSPVEQIQREQEELNILITRIQDTNIGEQRRLDLLNELNRTYPDFLENLDIEKVTNQELTTALREANDEYERRALVQENLNPLLEAQNALEKAEAENARRRDVILENIGQLRDDQGDKIERLNLLRETESLTTEQLNQYLAELNVALKNNISLQDAREKMQRQGIQATSFGTIATNDLARAEENYARILEETEQRLLNRGISQERVNEILSDFGLEVDKVTNSEEEASSATDKTSTSLRLARESYLRYKKAIEQPITLPDDSPLKADNIDTDTELGDMIIQEGSERAIQERIRFLETIGSTLNKNSEQYKEIQEQIAELRGETEGVTAETEALLGFANLVGNAFLQAAIHGKELDDVLKGILAQLASKAFILGLGALLTGGASLGGDKFLTALFSGFAGGVTDYKGGTALVGEEGPELVNLPRGANVITNENTRRLIDSANKIGHSPSSMANNIANTSVQNISQRVDLGGVSQEVGRAVSQAMSGARLVVGDMGELMVEFRRESKDQKALGGKSYIQFNDI